MWVVGLCARDCNELQKLEMEVHQKIITHTHKHCWLYGTEDIPPLHHG